MLVHLVNAFTEGDQGGNPAGVVLDAGALTREQKQSIARQLNTSETAFVSPSRKAEFRVEFFTPSRQIPHCGHATVATFHVLAREGLLSCTDSSKETIEDVRKIVFRDDLIFMEQKTPHTQPVTRAGIDPDDVARAIGLGADDLAAEPAIVSTGNPWLIVPLGREATLGAARPALDLVERISERAGVVGYYTIAPQAADPARWGARMFAPLFGIAEESATGSAAGPGGCYAHGAHLTGERVLIFKQGHLMQPPSPSRLEVRLNIDGDRIANLLVGGRAAIAGTAEISPD